MFFSASKLLNVVYSFLPQHVFRACHTISPSVNCIVRVKVPLANDPLKTDQKSDPSHLDYSFKSAGVKPTHLYVKSIMLTVSQVTAALFKITHVRRGLQYDSHMFSVHVCRPAIMCCPYILIQKSLSTLSAKCCH